MKIKPYTMMLTMLAGWINQQQQEAINYLVEENRILKEKYCEYYHTSRPHGGLDYEMINPPPKGKGEVVCKEWLGGTLKSWHRAA